MIIALLNIYLVSKRTSSWLVILSLFFLLPVLPKPVFAADENYREISLKEALQLALRQNRGILQEKLSLEASGLNIINQEADFDIKVIPSGIVGYTSDEDEAWNVGATISKKFSSGITASVRPEVGDGDDGVDTALGFSLSVPLLRGLGEKYAKDGVYTSYYSLERAKNSFVKSQENTVLQTVEAVYRALESQQQADFLNKQLVQLKHHLALATLKEKAGVITMMDLYRAEIRIKEVQEELTSTREQLYNYLDQIKQILALPLSSAIVVRAPIEYEPMELDDQVLVPVALDNRIEILQNGLDLEESKRAVRIAKNNLLPQLDLELGYNKFGDKVLFDLPEESWTASLSSDTDLFRTVEKNRYEESRLDYRRLLLSSEELQEQIIREVRSEINSLTKQQKRILIRKEQIRQARGKLKLSESKFRHGMANNFDLLESQTQYQKAQTELLYETVAYITGTYRFRSVLGTLIDKVKTIDEYNDGQITE